MNVSANQRWVLLTSLKAATSYQFRVSAVNTVGEGPPSDPTEVLTLPQEGIIRYKAYINITYLNYHHKISLQEM